MKFSSATESSLCVSPARMTVPRFVSISLLALCFFKLPSLLAQRTKASEYEVKAAYLYNLSRFVQWSPEDVIAKGNSFSICVFGPDPFGAILDTTLAGESIDGETVVARRVSNPQDAVNCRVLYISLSEENRLKEILVSVGKAGVLTVSDIPLFSQRGGIIQFVTVGNKIRFEVNLTNAQIAGLTLSSDLLKVAVAVRKSPQPGD